MRQNQLPSDGIARRSDEFLTLSARLRSKHQAELVGQLAQVLLESQNRDGSWLGYTETYDFSRLYFNYATLPLAGTEGDIWQVEILEARDDEIICKPLSLVAAGYINS